MRIAYLLESAELSGGVRVVLDQARALSARGHQVAVLVRRGEPDWYPYPVPWQRAPDLTAALAAFAPEVTIATFWTTIPDARSYAPTLAVHLCQGIEFDFAEYADHASAIRERYLEIRHKLVVGPWLEQRLCEHFGPRRFAIASVGQCVALELYRPRLSDDWRMLWQDVPTLLLPGMNTPVKGIETALRAIRLLRSKGLRIRVLRVSPIPIDRAAEGLCPEDEVFVGVAPAMMATLYRAASLVVTPSQPAEGFGLPFAEALACRRPVVASAIPSFLSLDARADYAFFVPPDDVAALAQAIEHALSHRWQSWRRALRGARLVRRFSPAGSALRIEQALRAWRSSRA